MLSARAIRRETLNDDTRRPFDRVPAQGEAPLAPRSGIAQAA